MSDLSQKQCVACKGGVPPLAGNDLALLKEQLDAAWRIINEHHLEREFKFPDFRLALEFTNRVGVLAEAQNHHPDIYLAWGKGQVDALDPQNRWPDRKRFRLRCQG